MYLYLLAYWALLRVFLLDLLFTGPGEALWSQGESEVVVHMFKRARDGFAATFDRLHPSTLRSVLSICILSCVTEDKEEAKRTFTWVYN